MQDMTLTPTQKSDCRASIIVIVWFPSEEVLATPMMPFFVPAIFYSFLLPDYHEATAANSSIIVDL